MELRTVLNRLGVAGVCVLFMPVHTRAQSPARIVDPPPSIRAVVAPPADAAGWHNSDVTVTFECRRTLWCPEPIVVRTDGADQHVTSGAADAHGRPVEVSVRLNIDKTAATVRIERTRASAPDVLTIRAHATDALSGVTSAFCNGRPATLADARIECDVPLQDGLNDVVVSTVDRAGNSASAGTQLLHPAHSPHLLAFPRTATIRIGDKRAVYLFDSAWQRIPPVRWTSDNPAVATVDPATGTVTGVAEGETPIVAWSEDGRSAAMTLTVTAERDIPLGTTLWVGHPLPGTVVGQPLPPPFDRTIMMGTQVDAAGRLSVSALRTSGEPLWFTLTAAAPGERVHTSMTDHTGNPLLWVDDGRGRSAIVRTGRLAEGKLWRYELGFSATGFWALGWDGTLWVVETPRHGYPHVNALDYLTGEVKFRVPVPIAIAPRSTARNDIAVARPSAVGPPFVVDGNEVAIPYAVTEVGPAAEEAAGGRLMAMRRVYLLRITPERNVRSEELLGFTSAAVEALPTLRLGDVRPQGPDGVIVLMQATYPDGRSHGVVMRRSGERLAMFALPVARDYVEGEDQAYTTDGNTVVAFDGVSGSVNWTYRSEEPLELYFATKGGGVIVRMQSGTYRFDTDGTLERLFPYRAGHVPQ